MFRNYLKTALRGMRRHLAFAVINVLGLALGLVAGLFILLWVQDELSFDRDVQNVEQIYRVMRTARHGEGQTSTTPSLTARLDEVLVSEYPEITAGALQTWEQSMSFSRGELTFRESGRHAGIDYFKIFSYPFLAGDRNTALVDPTSVVLSESMARKYFGDVFEAHAGNRTAAAADVIGRVLRLDNRLDVSVTGVFEDIRQNATIRFDYVLPIEEFTRRNSWMNGWTNNGVRMFVTLQEGADADAVSRKIAGVIKEHAEESISELQLQPFSDMYLWSEFEDGKVVGGRIEYIHLFSLVGIFILLIAGINFMNLATARSAQRSLEIGIRKTFGGTRGRLAAQFLTESVLTSMFALAIAVVAVALLLPSFNSITGKSIGLDATDPFLWATFIGLAVATGVIAGSYPAIYLSGANLVSVLRGGATGTARGAGLRKGLVVFQFAVSVILIVGTVTVYKQLNFIQTQNLGMDRENVFYSVLEGAASERFEQFRAQLTQDPSIVNVSAGSENPLDVNISTGGPQWDGKSPDDVTLYYVITTGYDYVETMEMEIADGRTFSREFGSDSLNVVINETAARTMGMEEPVGQRLALWGREGQIIGVVKDFHMSTMYNPIQPLILRLEPEDPGYVFIRAAAGQTQAAVATFERAFNQFNPEFPFEYTFLDTEFDEAYRSEVVVGKLVSYFAWLAIVVACLGLFGLAAFTAARRTREIGIRKVLGGSVAHVVVLLSQDFLKLVVIGFAIGAPVAYYLMNGWLSGFAYHTRLGPSVFLGTAASVTFVALVTVGYQSLKAALANPATSLRSE